MLVINAEKCKTAANEAEASTSDVASLQEAKRLGRIGTSSDTPSSSRRSSVAESTSPMTNVPSTANRFFQEAKEQLEQSGKLKASIRKTVTNSFLAIYEIILWQHESRMTLQIQLEKVKFQVKDEIENREGIMLGGKGAWHECPIRWKMSTVGPPLMKPLLKYNHSNS